MMADVDWHRTGDQEAHIITLDDDELAALQELLGHANPSDYEANHALIEALG
jgi:hypothetical protein